MDVNLSELSAYAEGNHIAIVCYNSGVDVYKFITDMNSIRLLTNSPTCNK